MDYLDDSSMSDEDDEIVADDELNENGVQRRQTRNDLRLSLANRKRQSTLALNQMLLTERATDSVEDESSESDNDDEDKGVDAPDGNTIN